MLWFNPTIRYISTNDNMLLKYILNVIIQVEAKTSFHGYLR